MRSRYSKTYRMDFRDMTYYTEEDRSRSISRDLEKGTALVTLDGRAVVTDRFGHLQEVQQQELATELQPHVSIGF